MKALTQEEHLQMDLVQIALDHFTTALERGKKIKDDEIKAEAQSLIGQILYKVIKDNTKAFTYFFNTIEISDKFENAHLKLKPWFIKSKAYFDEINNSMKEEKEHCYTTPPSMPKPPLINGPGSGKKEEPPELIMADEEQ